MTWTSLRSGMASSGVRVSAQIAPAIPNTVRMITKKALRALASIIRSSRNGLAAPGTLESCVLVGVGSDIESPGFQRALHLRFRINEEVRAADNPLAFLQPGLEFVCFTVFAAQLNKSRFEFAFSSVNKGNVAQASRQNG